MTKTNKAAKITKTGNALFPISVPLPPGIMNGNGWGNQETEETGTPIPPRKLAIDINSDEMKAAKAWSKQMQKDLTR